VKRSLLVSIIALALVIAPAIPVAADGGFDEYGYNDSARVFVGTGASWSLAKGLPADYLGTYAPDRLVMKWNAEWDRGNDEGWNDPNGYAARLDNEWNGASPGRIGRRVALQDQVGRRVR